jgi:hypothetical protein
MIRMKNGFIIQKSDQDWESDKKGKYYAGTESNRIFN